MGAYRQPGGPYGGGPYAVRTKVGWVLNGPLWGGNDCSKHLDCSAVTANRISVVQSEEMLVKLACQTWLKCHRRM